MILAILQELDLPFGILRENLYFLRLLTIVVYLYIIFQIAQRIKEAGWISTTTGFTLYMIGFSIFQLGLTLQLFYENEVHEIDRVYNFANFFYLVTMALYSLLNELDQKKYFTEELKGILGYKWSILSGLGFAIFIPFIILDTNNFNYAFLFMTIPFIASNLSFFRRFSSLEIIKKSHYAVWFGVGLAISGFSNFLLTLPFLDMPVLIALQALIVILGTLMMVYGWAQVPPLSELEWYTKLKQLIVIQRASSLVVYSYAFQTEDKSKADNSVLAGGALSGIQTLLSEILDSKKLINQIDHDDKTIYFNHGASTTYVLFTQGKAFEFYERLTQFASAFEEKFANTIANWKGNLGDFEGADSILSKIFKR